MTTAPQEDWAEPGDLDVPLFDIPDYPVPAPVAVPMCKARTRTKLHPLHWDPWPDAHECALAEHSDRHPHVCKHCELHFKADQ